MQKNKRIFIFKQRPLQNEFMQTVDRGNGICTRFIVLVYIWMEGCRQSIPRESGAIKKIALKWKKKNSAGKTHRPQGLEGNFKRHRFNKDAPDVEHEFY